jgi:hypothetical protein
MLVKDSCRDRLSEAPLPIHVRSSQILKTFGGIDHTIHYVSNPQTVSDKV